MGSNTSVAANNNYRRREFLFLFYFVVGFIAIRVWIIIAATNDELIELIAAGLTFLLLICIIYRIRYYRLMRENALRSALLGENNEFNTLEVYILPHGNVVIERNRTGGLTLESIDALESFIYQENTNVDSISKPETDRFMQLSLTDANQTVLEQNNSLIPTQNSNMLPSTLDNSCVLLQTEQNTGLSSGRPQNYFCHSSSGCSICLNEYSQGDLLVRLPCSHIYHKPCISEWLQLKIFCPLCKQPVITAVPRSTLQNTQPDYQSPARSGEPLLTYWRNLIASPSTTNTNASAPNNDSNTMNNSLNEAERGEYVQTPLHTAESNRWRNDSHHNAIYLTDINSSSTSQSQNN